MGVLRSNCKRPRLTVDLSAGLHGLLASHLLRLVVKSANKDPCCQGPLAYVLHTRLAFIWTLCAIDDEVFALIRMFLLQKNVKERLF